MLELSISAKLRENKGLALFRECSSITDPTIDTSQCYDGQTTEWQYIGGGIGINLPADMAIYQVRVGQY